MGLTIKENTKVAIMEEVTEGTYVGPASGGDFLGVIEGMELTPAKALLERSVLTGSIGKVTPRTGVKSVSGKIAVELKAGASDGAAPEAGPLLRAALGTSRNQGSDIVTKASGNTASVLQIADADISKLKVGDIVLIKQANAYHVSPITAIDSTGGAATATLLVPHPSGDCTDSVHIKAFYTYFTANTGHPSLSISKYVEDAITEEGIGCRVSNMSMKGFSTGALPQLDFTVEGLNFSRSVAAPAYTQSLDSSLPPVVLNATVYMDGSALAVNDLAFTVANNLAFASSTASANGRISGRIASRQVTGSINPYKQSDSVTQYTKFVNNTEFSLFAYAYNPTSTSGEFNQVVAVYLPKCIVTELSEGDKDGLLQDAISFHASRGSDGATEEVYVGFV